MNYSALSAEDVTETPLRRRPQALGFPKSEGQSLSYWLQQVRCDPLLDHRTTGELPKEVDTVIIGSGITGTLVAKHHLEKWPEKKVVVLEAREFCSGATGRNAGHCKPDQYRGFAKYEKAFGKEQALKILQNEQDTRTALVSYVQSHNVDCDLWIGNTLDVPIDDEVARITKTVYNCCKNAGANMDHIAVTEDADVAAQISRVKGAKACYAWPASTLQPWKLTAHIMRENIKLGVNLQTYTTVEEVIPATSSLHTWVVRSDRGEIACNTVVHASNAYIAAVEPSLRGIITPTPHMCNKVIPPRGFSGNKVLQNSYGILLPNGGLISINTRCNSDGVMMFGGSNAGQRELDEWIASHPEKATHDQFSGVVKVTNCIRELVRENFEGWREAAMGPGEGFDYDWSGIIGRSADGVPFIGELPDKPGQWVCAGHHGHGMARIFTAAPGLVKLVDGQPWQSTGLPEVYHMTAERLRKLKDSVASSHTTNRVAVV